MNESQFVFAKDKLVLSRLRELDGGRGKTLPYPKVFSAICPPLKLGRADAVDILLCLDRQGHVKLMAGGRSKDGGGRGVVMMGTKPAEAVA